MRITYAPIFKRVLKKTSKQFQDEARKQVSLICDNPTIGVQKKGDLSGVYVHKYKFNNQQVLIAYTFCPESRHLILLASHENFYRDLKKGNSGGS